MNDELQAWLKSFYAKKCFYCQGTVSGRLNPLKETKAGNWIHKDCIADTQWLEPYTESTLNPPLKRKVKEKK
jgi:hypothetical protein